jgi:hypothetical protein
MALVVDQAVETKLCIKCKESQPLSNFSPAPSKKDGLYPYCKPCANAQQRHRYQNNVNGHRDKDRIHSTKRHYKVNYGLAEEVILQIMQSRSGECEICKTNTELVVDHNHSTGKVRGRICGLCNTMLGHARDSVDNLSAAIKYLEKNG